MRNIEFFKERMLENIGRNKAFEKAKKIIEDNEIRPDNFRKLYGDSNVDADQKYVADMERRFQRGADPETKKINEQATVLEAIIFEQSEQSEWFGPQAETIKTSRYDDIRNGVDMIAEFIQDNQSASHLGMAIDATFNSDTRVKLERIKREIEEGKLAEIKYFQSENIYFKGRLKMVPRLVVGAEAKTIDELSELWLARNNKALARHHIQFQILEEIIVQLKAFKNYAQKIGQEEIAKIYSRALSIIQPIFTDKKKELGDRGMRDSVFLNIRINLSMFK